MVLYFTVLVKQRVFALTTEYLYMIYYNCTTELYAAVRPMRCMYLYIPAMYFCCCSVVIHSAVVAAADAACSCRSSSCAGWQTPLFSFRSFKHALLLMYVPVGRSVASAASTYL